LGKCSETFSVFTNDVRQLIDNGELRQTIGEKAEKFSKEYLSQEVMVKKFDNVLSSLK
jgi:glycosyltransferase involved in cell wall biosynthesis